MATLVALRARGFRLSIDDFGTGHSSLSYVHRLPVHCLKVDRSFLSRERGTGETEVVMRAIVELGRQLGLRVVAEGVETEAEMDRLRALGCELAQGYYFAAPQSADRVAQAVRGARARTLWRRCTLTVAPVSGLQSPSFMPATATRRHARRWSRRARGGTSRVSTASENT